MSKAVLKAVKASMESQDYATAKPLIEQALQETHELPTQQLYLLWVFLGVCCKSDDVRCVLCVHEVRRTQHITDTCARVRTNRRMRTRMYTQTYGLSTLPDVCSYHAQKRPFAQRRQ
jgi:hypothetical protein